MSQKKSFLTTPDVEKKIWSPYATLESTGEMNLMCLQNDSGLKFIFSSSYAGKLFLVLHVFQATVYVFSFRTALKIIRISS